MKREKAAVVRTQARVRGKGSRGGGGGISAAASDKLSTVIAGAIVLAVVAAICILVTTMAQRAWKYAVDTDRLYVEAIVVNGARALTVDEVIAISGLKRNEPILSVDLAAAAERIMKHARVEKAVVERHLPRTIEVNVTERVPIGLVHEGAVIKGIDASGKIVPLIPAREDIKGPIITGDLKDLSSEIVREALQAIELMRPDLVTRISEVRVDPNGGITLLTTGQTVVIRLGRGEMPRKIERLKTAIKRFEERGEVKEYIDVRFEDLVTRP
ncbi:MAG: FtsQ-type POTRA domain-containing protein [Candidatus Hydrogenedentota bacterium]